MNLDYQILTAGMALTGVMAVFFAVVKEANDRASKIDAMVIEFNESKQRDVDNAILTSAKEILAKNNYEVTQLSSDERHRFYTMVNASANLWSMKETVSKFKDRTTMSYIWGLGLVTSASVATILLSITDNPTAFILGGITSYVAFFAGATYFRDGIIILRSIRRAEKAVERMKRTVTVEKLGEEVQALLKVLGVTYLTAEE